MSEYKKVKIGDICKIVKGSTGIASAEPGEYPLVVTSVKRKTCSTYQFDCEAVCIPLVSSSGHGKKSLNNVHFQSGKFALGTILCAVIPNNPEEVSASYLHQYLQFYKDTVLVPLMKGAANVSLSMRDIATVEIPLPDFSTQTELAKMFVDIQNKLKEINLEFEKQSGYTKQLRQNILQDAIEGKLTATWRKTHPVVKGNPDFDAEALFEQIVAGKASFPSFAKSKTSKTFQPINDDEKPFEIPEGWKWVRLNQIADVGTGATPLTSEKRYYENGTIPWITSSSTGNEFVTEADDYITQEAINETNCNLNPIGTLIVAMYGQGKTRGQITELFIEAATNQACATIQLPNIYKESIQPYVKNVFKKMYQEIRELAQGGAQPNLNLGKISSTLIPFPPAVEQREINYLIDKLLKNIGELDYQISQREEYVNQLMQSILKDAFEER